MSRAVLIPSLLRSGLAGERSSGPALGQLLAIIVACGMFYGAVMGSYPSEWGIRPLQMLYSASKVPFLLLATFTLSLPSFFVLNTLFGLREDFGEAMRALLSTQAALTVILASFAPFTALWYCSFADYPSAILYNALMFGSASVCAQTLLRRLYRPLIRKSSRHRYMLVLWLLIYAFVGIQMGWVLRPFIGDPTGPTRLLRHDAWSNAYTHVMELAGKAVGHR